MEYQHFYTGEIPEYINYIQDSISNRLMEEYPDLTGRYKICLIPIKTYPVEERYPMVNRNDGNCLYIYIIDPSATCSKLLCTGIPKYYGVLDLPITKYKFHKKMEKFREVVDTANYHGLNTGLDPEQFTNDVMVCNDNLTIYEHVKLFISEYRNRTVSWGELQTIYTHIDEQIKNNIMSIITTGKENRQIIVGYEEYDLDIETIRLIEAYNALVS